MADDRDSGTAPMSSPDWEALARYLQDVATDDADEWWSRPARAASSSAGFASGAAGSAEAGRSE